MPRKAKRGGSKKPADNPKDEALETSALDDRVIERPDGFYWESKKSGRSYGPFPTLAEAEADMIAGGVAEEESDPEGLHEAESDLGINEWIDPDTGGPAEDNVPRLEDH